MALKIPDGTTARGERARTLEEKYARERKFVYELSEN